MKMTILREYTPKEIEERTTLGILITPKYVTEYTIPECPIIPTIKEVFTDILMGMGFHPDAIDSIIKQ